MRTKIDQDDVKMQDYQLLERRPDDVKPGRFLNIRTNYDQNIDAYIRTFRAFILAEWELACKVKNELNLYDIDLKLAHDDFDYLPDSMQRFQDKKQIVKRMANFLIPYSHINRGNGECSIMSFNSHVEIGDIVSITFIHNSEGNQTRGKIINIVNNRVFVVLEFKQIDFAVIRNRYDSLRCNVHFIPCDAVFRRQAFALDHLRNRSPTDPIRQTILGQISSNHHNADNHRKVFTVLTDASYQYSDVKFIATPMQTEAVNRTLSQPFSLVQGPPGCGKTKVISAMVIHLLNQSNWSNEKILVCGTSNAVVQNLASILLPAIRNLDRKFVWLATASRDIIPSSTMSPEYESLAYIQMLTDESQESQYFRVLQEKAWQKQLNGEEINRADELRQILEKRLCAAADVICCTLETAARECLDDLRFTIVIMDEATQAVEPSALIPMIHGAEKIVLVGDQQQLGPIVSDRILEQNGYGWSLFERLIEAGTNYVMLDRQFRMHPEISAFPNKQFYENRIQNGITVDNRLGPILQCFPNRKLPLMFFDCSGDESKIRRSFANELEATIVKQVIEMLRVGGISPSQIGVITPYRGQVELLEEMLRPDPSMLQGMKIATVDSFQGGERDYIVMSCVRNGRNIGFVKDERRMNVSITRARYGLIIIGNRETLSYCSKTWCALCSHFETKGVLFQEFPRPTRRFSTTHKFIK
jgi:superfamily I DNA and/or RNA helicase